MDNSNNNSLGNQHQMQPHQNNNSNQMQINTNANQQQYAQQQPAQQSIENGALGNMNMFSGSSVLTPHTVSNSQISAYPTMTRRGSDLEADDEQQQMDEMGYSPGQIYSAAADNHQYGDTATYQENRTQFAPRQMQQPSNQVAHGAEEADEYSHGNHAMNRNQEGSDEQEERKVQPRFLTQKQPNQAQKTASSTSLTLQNQGSQSSLMRQFSDKIKMQAERLQKLETYKRLCERRILDFDQYHSLPVTEEMIGTSSEATRDPAAMNAQHGDYKRQLALKEQELGYAKQRSEKALKENEYLRQELEEMKARQETHQAPTPNSENEQSLKDQLKNLEEEKNALLDYIEESVNVTATDISPLKTQSMKDDANNYDAQQHRMTLNDMQAQVMQLQAQNQELSNSNHDLLQKLADYEQKLTALNTARGEETFGNLPTGLTARSPTGVQHTGMSNATLPQVQSIDYMVLDLNAVKQELMDTQNQFNTTQNVLNATRQEKQDILQRLEEAQSRIVDLEQQMMNQNGSTSNVQNPWQNTMQSEQPPTQRTEMDMDYKVKLVEERDRLLDQKSQLQDKISQQNEENHILKTTLDETQQELENLVNEHERVSSNVQGLQGQIKEAQDLPRRLRQEAQGIRDELDEKKNEVKTLQDEIKNLSGQAEMNMDTLKQLRAHNLKLESQMIEMRDNDDSKAKTQTKQWEMTITDLTKDLKEAQTTIVEKDTVFQKVERELRNKLHQVEDQNSQKSDLLRRIEDLNHEVRQFQAKYERKESQSKEQTRQIEELKFEVERLTIQLQKLDHEKNQTQELRKEDFGVIEIVQQKVDRQAKVINKICRDISKVQELVNSISREFNMPRIQSESVPTQDRDGRSKTLHLEEQLREANGFLKQIGDWLVSFAKNFKHSQKSLEIAQSEAQRSREQVKMMDQKIMTAQQDEFQAREQGKFLSTELNTLKNEVQETHTLQKDGYEREERIHKKNQQMKTQIEAMNIQKEKLAIQIKTLLSEKEAVKESFDHKSVENQEISERSKMYELQISQLVEQKQSVLDLFTRFKDAFPSDSLREVFAQIIEVVEQSHLLDQEFVETENKLLSKEGQLRKYAKREVEGLLSTKVINIRKEVEQGRVGLRVMHQSREELENRLNELELELKQNETIERRRTDVALDTEQSLTQTRKELQDVRKELIFIQRNRNDIEVALKASQQEREMVQRELLTLRHQLQLKADLNPDNWKSASSARKITSYNATSSSIQTAGVDHLPINSAHAHRAFSGDRASKLDSVALRHGQPQPTAQFPSLVQDGSITRHMAYNMGSDQEYRRTEVVPDHLHHKRRFPSQEPAMYQSQTNENRDAGNIVPPLPPMRMTHHQPLHSDLPLQMPNLTDRAGEKMRPSMYGGVMSGNGAQATTAQSHLDQKPPSSARNQNRPPTYQSTASVSKRSGSALAAPNSTSFNPLPQSKTLNQDHQYMTGNFANNENAFDERDRNPTLPETSVHTMRHTHHQHTRSNSVNNLHTAGQYHQTSGTNNASHVMSGEPLHPIMSQYGGEVTSRSGQQSPSKERFGLILGADRSRESPLRSSNKVGAIKPFAPENAFQKEERAPAARTAMNSSLQDDSKLDAHAYAMQDVSTQKSHSAYDHHRSSVNESSIHNKLSALRNVFSQIRQNLDESSMTGTKTAGQHSVSIEQSIVQQAQNNYC